MPRADLPTRAKTKKRCQSNPTPLRTCTPSFRPLSELQSKANRIMQKPIRSYLHIISELQIAPTIRCEPYGKNKVWACRADGTRRARSPPCSDTAMCRGGRHPPGAGTRTDGPYIRKKEEAPSLRRGPPLARESAPLWPAASCSPTDCTAVPSALGGLASGFGMGPGVTPPPWPPATKGRYSLGGGPLGRALRAAQRDRHRGPLQKVARRKSSAD